MSYHDIAGHHTIMENKKLVQVVLRQKIHYIDTTTKIKFQISAVKKLISYFTVYSEHLS